ncbi:MULTISPECIES: arsenic resistance N-acetyltransferase ArsN2 [Halococcus]|uniref:N-acetyltransferase GCN5 n=1 Tax=Halococcus salifodinae DSM 8989 TaxID=1227456 RepID=M0N7L1_9EURY|nr:MULTISPECIES: arsenic resistance N-acetyltransferase ArsN2 [Halococcus]EMA52660.1 N-acetyltransferase GCN5 [Halococcus salifodinae DSM 8989]
MSGETITIQQADDSHCSYIEALLERNDLPSRNIRSKPDCFYLGYEGGDPVGIAGIEGDEAEQLLRSVVVERSARGNGFGTALCDALEERASADGVEALFLLTTTAADFFADRGYAEIERSAAPPTIQATTEFGELCPATATCMRKFLQEPPEKGSFRLPVLRTEEMMFQGRFGVSLFVQKGGLAASAASRSVVSRKFGLSRTR